MSSSGVGPPPDDPLGQYYRVEEAERLRWEEDKKNKGRPPGGEPPEDEKSWTAFAYLFLDKVVDFIKGLLKRGVVKAGAEPVREDLLLVKAALQTMMAEDRSQDSHFLKKLSLLWQKILEDAIDLHASPIGPKLKALIKDIETYPKEDEHTFGYYLEEYAGLKWLPFPYMDLIRKLHHQHMLDPPSSLLTRWALMIQEILHLD